MNTPEKEEAESVRLVIWDLDETFWSGTLSEGSVDIIQSNINIIRELNNRGIINSICSKNDFNEAKEKLVSMGIWDEFVFPKISWQPKGELIKQIIADTGLRSSTVMFIDDNVMNLNEAKFYNNEIQVSLPTITSDILDQKKFSGKEDGGRSRLKQYKLLEEKTAIKNLSTDNVSFLRESHINISFHNDVIENFDRIHDLVNRTNQLNFTKRRWPEDRDSAFRLFMDEVGGDFYADFGYIKVSDKFGYYGIVGFYMIHRAGSGCIHFLFSCRTLNMGVEQFVYKTLHCPKLEIVGNVAASLNTPVDWVSVVDDAEKRSNIEISVGIQQRPRVCIRGACDMAMISNYLRLKADTIEEQTTVYKGWEICPLPRIIAVHSEISLEANKHLLDNLFGLPPKRFESSILNNDSDVFVMSFSQESFQGYYRARSTGLIIPMGNFRLGHERHQDKLDYTMLDYETIIKMGVEDIPKEQWDFFRQEFQFVGAFNEDRFRCDIVDVFSNVVRNKKQLIVIGLNEKVGRDKTILAFFEMINNIVRPVSLAFNAVYIDVNEFIVSESDLMEDGHYGGPHFSRKTYKKISDKISEIITNTRERIEVLDT